MQNLFVSFCLSFFQYLFRSFSLSFFLSLLFSLIHSSLLFYIFFCLLFNLLVHLLPNFSLSFCCLISPIFFSFSCLSSLNDLQLIHMPGSSFRDFHYFLLVFLNSLFRLTHFKQLNHRTAAKKPEMALPKSRADICKCLYLS